MTVKELIEKLSKLDPDLECFTIDSDGEWCRIVDAWGEFGNTKDFAYLETLGPVESI